jgi:hypothetical protein
VVDLSKFYFKLICYLILKDDIDTLNNIAPSLGHFPEFRWSNYSTILNGKNTLIYIHSKQYCKSRRNFTHELPSSCAIFSYQNQKIQNNTTQALPACNKRLPECRSSHHWLQCRPWVWRTILHFHKFKYKLLAFLSYLNHYADYIAAEGEYSL